MHEDRLRCGKYSQQLYDIHWFVLQRRRGAWTSWYPMMTTMMMAEAGCASELERQREWRLRETEDDLAWMREKDTSGSLSEYWVLRQ